MNLERFTRARGDAWNELAGLVRDAERRPAKLGAARVRRLGTLYRATAADLAVARRRYPGDPVVTRLEALVGAARQLVYAAPARRESFLEFVRRGYWRLVVERPLALLVSALLLFAPVGLAGTWALRDPGAASGLVPGAYRAVTEPRPQGNDLGK
jgi:hypothetical protein